MKFILSAILLTIQVFLYGQSASFYNRIAAFNDSTKVADLVIYNTFKHQILAHQNHEYDSSLIVEKVYKPHPQLWDSCLALIFGDAGKMYQKQGIIDWNHTLFEKQPTLLNKIDTFSKLNLDSIFKAHLNGLQKLTGLKAKGKWVLYLGPDENYSLFMGGCSANGMAIDLAHSRTTVSILTEALPHELEHMVFEQAKKSDSSWTTSLGATLDEGLACYYTYKYFKGKLPKQRVVENMTKEQFEWYLQREKEIYQKSLPYLLTSSKEQNPYQCNCRSGGCTKLFAQAPKTICYFLGFRIIEFYTKKHGPNSWTDIYRVPLKLFWEQSGYDDYIKSLK